MSAPLDHPTGSGFFRSRRAPTPRMRRSPRATALLCAVAAAAIGLALVGLAHADERAPAPVETYSLGVVFEDAFFVKPVLESGDVAAIIATGMPLGACIHASRLMNAYGAFTACIPEN